MINVVTIVGRLTKDPDLRYTQGGAAVTNFTVAVDRPFTNQQGNREADFVNCVIWKKPAESLANYMKKGGRIGVVGRIQTRSFEGQDGKMVYVTEVVASSVQFLESKNNNRNDVSRNEDATRQQNQQPQQDNPYNHMPKDSGEPIDISDDDLPF